MAKVELVPIEDWHLDHLHDWRNSPHVMPYCRQYRPLSRKHMEKWYEDLHKDRDFNLTNDMFAVEYDALPIGVAGLVRIDWKNRKAEVSFYVGDEKLAVLEVFSEAISKLKHYAFKILGLRKIYFPVYDYNPHLESYRQILTEEYVAKEEYFWEGAFHDRVVLVAYDK